MDKNKFFQLMRQSSLFGARLSQRQVDGLNALLQEASDLPTAFLANILAQVFRETGGGMYPVKETVFPHHKDQNPSDSTVIHRLNTAYDKGQLTWVKSRYWLGGHFGRGVIQLTHKDGYAKASALTGVDLVSNPSKALDVGLSAKIAVQGMVTGMFTGKKLSDYDGKTFDHSAARAIVNGDMDKVDRGSKYTVGQIISRNAVVFEQALDASGWGSEPVTKVEKSPLLLWLEKLFGVSQ